MAQMGFRNQEGPPRVLLSFNPSFSLTLLNLKGEQVQEERRNKVLDRGGNLT